MSGVCEHCGQPFEARRRSARFCSGRCQKAAARRRSSPAAPRPGWSRAEVIEELVAMIELIPEDAAVLEARYVAGADPEMDDVIGGLWCTLAAVEQIHAWFTRNGGAR